MGTRFYLTSETIGLDRSGKVHDRISRFHFSGAAMSKNRMVQWATKCFSTPRGELPWSCRHFIGTLGKRGPDIGLTRAFEIGDHAGAAARFPEFADVERIIDRVVDLAMVNDHYYPDMKGSWPIKASPAIASAEPDLYCQPGR